MLHHQRKREVQLFGVKIFAESYFYQILNVVPVSVMFLKMRCAIVINATMLVTFQNFNGLMIGTVDRVSEVKYHNCTRTSN